ncbi:MAG: PIN domain-containing protein [Nitrosomonadaceae bacterium]|nr:PIN domain-containing protein [Nitrosomonadaceae bacterium]
MKKHYVLVDYESVQPKSLGLLKPSHFHLRVFLGPKNTRVTTGLATVMQPMGARAEYVQSTESATNALDFYIVYYLGKLAQKEPLAEFTVISKDHGFDPLVEHLRKLGASIERAESIESMSSVAASPAASKASPAASAPNAAPPALASLIVRVVADLAKRKAAKPSKETTLLNTLRNVIGKDSPDDLVQAVLDALKKKKLISVDGGKVTYKLPS